MVLNRPASAVQWARSFIFPVLKNGSRAIDATAGNGHDTLFLAENVGPDGRVYAIDIQQEALDRTKSRLQGANLYERIVAIRCCHQELAGIIHEPVDAVMFNLGYLPGSDRSVLTLPDTSREGISAALKILNSGGRMSIVIYTGHPGGADEAVVVGNLLADLDHKVFSIQKMVFWNSRTSSPELFFISRSGEGK